MIRKLFARRSRVVAALALAALLVGPFAAYSTFGGAQAATSAGARNPGHATESPSTSESRSKLALHDEMRKLWEQHVGWTRLAIVEFAAGWDGFAATADRLLQNQVDIGDAIKPYYGEAAGDKLTSLLHDHITISFELVATAKAGDTAAFNDAKTRWYANANDIADFLAKANPKFWPKEKMRELMKVHLDQTLVEANHVLNGRFVASVNSYDRIETHILKLADVLSNGIIQAFSHKFS